MTRIDLPEYPFHEIAEVFPLMTGQDFEDLKRDINEHGQWEPIWLYQGRIIDGRNRYRACRDLNRPCLTREWDGNGSLIAFVQSLNLRRRHLDEAQRAMVAAKIKRRFEQEARERMMAGRRHEPEPPANCREPSKIPEKTDPSANLRQGKASNAAAREMNVSPRSVEAASKVLREGIPDLVKAVEQGEVAVSAAAEVARLPKVEQEPVVQAGPSAIVRRAAEIRTERVSVNRIDPEPEPKPARQWSAVGKHVFSSPLRKVLDEVRLAGGIVEYAGVMTAEQRHSAVKELKKLSGQIATWIKQLEKHNV